MAKDIWYKLDNAAQLFPMISNSNETNCFRLSAVLKETVDPVILKKVLIDTLERFPSFKVKLKKGFFWYYLEENDYEPLVNNENPYFCEANNYDVQRQFLFNVSYFEKRLTIEIFHSITDGTGGLEFFKSLLYNYLIEKGYKIKNNGEILTSNVEQLVDETQDSFKYNYKDTKTKKENESKGFKIKGLHHSRKWTGCINAICDVQSLKQVTKRYNVTVTEYIGALLIYSIYENYYKNSNSKYPIRLFVPVNARRFFDSKTLRNFVLFIRTNTYFKGEITFENVLEHVKETFEKELKKDQLLARIKTNVKLETNFLTRVAPLFLKKLIIKIGYKILGSDVNTISYSNLGIANVPKEMLAYIDRLEFANDVGKNTPINVSSVSIGNHFVLTFTSEIIERKFQKTVINMLQKDGVKIVVETNDLEVL